MGFLDNIDNGNQGFLNSVDNKEDKLNFLDNVETPEKQVITEPEVKPEKEGFLSKAKDFLSDRVEISKPVWKRQFEAVKTSFMGRPYKAMADYLESKDNERREEIDQIDSIYEQGGIDEVSYMKARADLVSNYDEPLVDVIGNTAEAASLALVYHGEAKLASYLTGKIFGISQVARHLDKLSVIPSYTIQSGSTLGLFKAIDDIPRLLMGDIDGWEYAKDITTYAVIGSLAGFKGGAIQKIKGNDWMIKVDPKKLWKLQQKVSTTVKERELMGYVNEFASQTGMSKVQLFNKTGKSFNIDLRKLQLGKYATETKFLTEPTFTEKQTSKAQKLARSEKLITPEVKDFKTLNKRVADLSKKQVLTHYGPKDLKVTDPKFMGTGYASDRAALMENYPSLHTKGTFYYKPTSTPEAGVVASSKQQYMTKIQGTTIKANSPEYLEIQQKAISDPEFIKKYGTNDKQANFLATEKAIKEAGYAAIDYPKGVYALTPQKVVPVKPFKVSKTILSKPGATLNADGSEAKGLDHMVGIVGETVPLSEFNTKTISKFAQKYSAIMAQYPELKIGIFKDKGQVDIDLSLNTNVKDATNIAGITNQKSIYNAAEGKVIETGGTGISQIQSNQDIMDIMETVEPGQNAPDEAFTSITNKIINEPSVQLKMQLNRYTHKPFEYTDQADIAIRSKGLDAMMKRASNAITKGKIAIDKPYDFLEQLDAGFPQAPFSKYIGEPLKQARHVEITLKHEQVKKWSEVYKKNPGFYSRKPINVGGRKLAKREIFTVAIQSQNKFGLNALKTANKFTDAQIAKSVQIAQSDTDIAKAIETWEEMSKSIYPLLASEYLNQTGEVLGEQESYLMMMRKPGYGSASGETDLTFLENELHKGAVSLSKQTQAVLDKSVLMDRALKSKAPLELDSERVVPKYIQDSSRYIASAPHLHKLRTLINEVKPDITEKLGAPVSQALGNIVDDLLINPPIDLTSTKDLFNATRGMLYKIGLGHNPFKTASKQFASYWNIKSYVSQKNMNRAMKDIASDPSGYYKEYMANAEMAERFMSPEMQMVQKNSQIDNNFLKEKFEILSKNWLMPIQMSDKPAAMLAYHSAIYEHLDKVPGDIEGAKRFAVEVVNKTQPSGDVAQRNPLQRRGGQLGATASVFQSQRKNIANNILTDYTKWKNGNIGTDDMAKTVFNQYIMQAIQLAITSMPFDAAAWVAWNKRDRAKAMVEYMTETVPQQAIGSMYLIGTIIQATKYGKGVVELPLNKVYEYGVDPFKVLMAEESDTVDLIESLVKSSVLLTGMNLDLPRQQIKNALRFIKGRDVSLAEWVTGGERYRDLKKEGRTSGRKTRSTKRKPKWENR